MVHAPVNVITVEREYGSHGAEFAQGEEGAVEAHADLLVEDGAGG